MRSADDRQRWLRGNRLHGGGFATTAALTLAASERSVDVFLIALFVSIPWTVYLRLAWRSPVALLPACSVLVVAAVFGFRLRTAIRDRAFLCFEVSNTLRLSARRTEAAMRNPATRVRAYEQVRAGSTFLSPRAAQRLPRARRLSKNGTSIRLDGRRPRIPERGTAPYYDQHSAIDVFIAGDSVLQGVGLPGVIGQVRSTLPQTVYSLSVAGYGPREKAEALTLFAPDNMRSGW